MPRRDRGRPAPRTRWRRAGPVDTRLPGRARFRHGQGNPGCALHRCHHREHGVQVRRGIVLSCAFRVAGAWQPSDSPASPSPIHDVRAPTIHGWGGGCPTSTATAPASTRCCALAASSRSAPHPPASTGPVSTRYTLRRNATGRDPGPAGRLCRVGDTPGAHGRRTRRGAHPLVRRKPDWFKAADRAGTRRGTAVPGLTGRLTGDPGVISDKCASDWSGGRLWND